MENRQIKGEILKNSNEIKTKRMQDNKWLIRKHVVIFIKVERAVVKPKF